MKKQLSVISHQSSAKQRFTLYAFGITLLSTVYCLLSAPSYAADTFRIGPPKGSSQQYGVQVNGSADSALQLVINNGLRIIYSIGAIAVVIYFVWGALDWVLAGGDKDKIGNARKKMTQSLIGLLLLALSAVILNVVGKILNLNPLEVLTIPGLGDAAGTTTVSPKTP